VSDPINNPKHRLFKLTNLHKSEAFKKSRFSRANLTIFAIIFAAIGGYIIYSSFAATSCDFNATSVATLNSSITSASNAGSNKVVCLATGTYSSWTGAGPTNPVIITAGSGATVNLANFSFGSGTQNFTIDGTAGGGTISTSGGSIDGNGTYSFQSNAPHSITIKNAAFTGGISIDYIVSNGTWPFSVKLDHDTFNNINCIGSGSCTPAARIALPYSNTVDSGVIVQNSTLDGGDADGIQTGATMQILNNEFKNIIDREPDSTFPNHTDPIQCGGGCDGIVIKSNFIHDNTDGIVAFDGMTGADIENNVVGSEPDNDCIDMYAVVNSTIKHNTCGPGEDIYFDHKSGDPVSSGNIIKDNVAPAGVNLVNDSTATTNTNNITNPVFTTSPPSVLMDYILKAGSPGKGTATDGGDVGANIATVGPQVSCTNVTTSTFASAVANAQTGDALCLASGNYGTWSGTNKAITVTPAPGASPQMQINFGSGDSGFTLDGMTGMGGTVNAGASNITIKNSTFISQLDIEGAMTNIVVDHNNFTYNVGPSCGGANSKIFLATSGASPGAAVTISNNDIEHGDLDGVHVGGGSGDLILNNTFKDLTDAGITCAGGGDSNHTDNIQFEGGSQIDVKGNYIFETQGKATQGITSFDSGTNGVIIENNVVDITRDWGIEWYSDTNSIIRHNTVVYHAAPYSVFGHATGTIDLENKSADPAGSGTHVYDNVAFVGAVAPTTGIFDHNTDPSTVSFVGGTSPTTHDGFLLTSTSVGHLAASDGTDTGVYTNGTGTGGTPPTVTLTANPTSANSGSSSTLTWSSSGASSCSATSPSGWTTSTATSGTKSVNPISTTTYTISCTGAGGANTANATVTINLAAGCFQSSTTWQNNTIASQTSTFTLDYDATPQAANINSVVGLSSGAATDYTSLATIVRFNDTGTIDARNGGAYAAVNNVPYTSGTSYHFKLTVNVTNHTYSATVNPSGGSTTTIATNYGFRTEQASVSSLSNWALFQDPGSAGSLNVCNVTLNQSTGPKTGDINNDNSVNITDLSLLLSSYNQNTTQCVTNNAYKCDLSSPADGVVNIFDLSILLSHYGT